MTQGTAGGPLARLAVEVELLLRPYLQVYAAPPAFCVRLAGLSGAPVYDRDGELAHVSASMLKLAVALAVLGAVDAGSLRLEDEVEVRNAFPSAAGGTFAVAAVDDSDAPLHLLAGERRTVADLVRRMISVSSNLATNLLLDLVDGPAAATDAAVALGTRVTAVRRYICDDAAAGRGVRNEMSAADAVRLLAALRRGDALSAGSSELLLGALRAQQYDTEIPRGLPRGCAAVVGNKTGWVPGVVHDAAVVEPPVDMGAPPYLLGIFTTGFADAPTASLLASRVSRACWDAWTSTVER